MSTKKNLPEVRITGVSEQLREELNNISDNEGVPLASLLKPQLRAFVNSYPDYMRVPKSRD